MKIADFNAKGRKVDLATFGAYMHVIQTLSLSLSNRSACHTIFCSHLLLADKSSLSAVSLFSCALPERHFHVRLSQQKEPDCPICFIFSFITLSRLCLFFRPRLSPLFSLL